ncbi:MAG: methyltransferase domain-containing protein [Gammaproteobacteria bacterium]|nr:methyltransferase domain-containing protein [Gammaproteobacteria bacterium]MCP5136952.1 methyltransferase domain-containing protein [Gammaproteobacteria bacterium]
MTDTGDRRVDFDEYADSYQRLLDEQLSFFSKDHGYFPDYKARWVAAHIKGRPARILDFGCGIGLSLPYLAQYFPDAKLHATDLSKASVAHVRKTYPGVEVVDDEDLDGNRFDLIFVAGVFHHIPVEERERVSRRLASLLSPGGEIFIFDHNPFNPVTRRMVSTCPFDADAVLLKRAQLQRLMHDVGGLEITQSSYCLYFPPALKALAFMEPWLEWLPLGGQYVVSGRR